MHIVKIVVVVAPSLELAVLRLVRYAVGKDDHAGHHVCALHVRYIVPLYPARKIWQPQKVHQLIQRVVFGNVQKFFVAKNHLPTQPVQPAQLVAVMRSVFKFWLLAAASMSFFYVAPDGGFLP